MHRSPDPTLPHPPKQSNPGLPEVRANGAVHASHTRERDALCMVGHKREREEYWTSRPCGIMLPRAEVLFSARPAQPKLLTGGLPCASSKLLSADGRGCPKGSPLAANTNGTQSCRPVLALWRCATAAAAGEGSSGARRGGAKLFVGVCTSEPECGPSREEPSLFEILHSDFRESNNLFELVTSFTQKARFSSWALGLPRGRVRATEARDESCGRRHPARGSRTR